MKKGNVKQPAKGKWQGLFEDVGFRRKADKRHAANKAARKARKAQRGR
jgi:hypothetical protein